MPIYHNGYIDSIRALGFEIAEVYYGRALVFSKDTDFGNDFFESVAGEYDFELTATGDYKIVIRGAGGASGSKSDTHNGGAGGKGQLAEIVYHGTKGEILHINIGEYGLTFDKGGNGGESLYDHTQPNQRGGHGGGGAKPTFISKNTDMYEVNVPAYGWIGSSETTAGAPHFYSYKTTLQDGDVVAGSYGNLTVIDGKVTYRDNVYTLARATQYDRNEERYLVKENTLPTSGQSYKLYATDGSETDLLLENYAGVYSIVPSDHSFETECVDTSLPEYRYCILYALGGGGGGGAGRSSIGGGRYQPGASGGGGGGYYRFNPDTLEIESVAGQTGPYGAGRGEGARAGSNGNITDFPALKAGNGNASGGTGGGASGGSGSNGGNHTSSTGGPGGAGAGGDLDAGGGENGATNHHITPTNTFVENWEHNVVGDYGIGGAGGVADGENGQAGFVAITYMGHHKVEETIDCMQIDESVDTEIDCEEITKKPDYRNDWGVLFETQPRRRLPDGYQELNYIESTGTQYIDTGHFLNPKYKYTIEFNATNDSTWVFGNVRGAGSGEEIGVFRTIVRLGNQNITGLNLVGKHTVEINQHGYSIDGNYKSWSPIFVGTKKMIYLFRANGSSSFGPARIYSFKIENENNEPVRDMIPAERMEDGKVGMFDIANNVFYTNAGTDEFIAGAIVYDYGTLGETTDAEDYGDVFILADIDKTINTGEI